MNRFDTLKIKVTTFSTALNPDLKKNLILLSGKNPGFGPTSMLNRALLKPGINDIFVKENGDVIVAVSSKILNTKYIELISLDTFSLVLGSLSEYLEFDCKRFMADAEVLLCHVTQNVPITAPAWNYLQALSCISHSDYKQDCYPLQRVGFEKIETVAFQKRHKGNKPHDYLSFYDKQKEMSSKGKKDKFCKSLTNFDFILNHFGSHLRVELQLRTFPSIRSGFNLSDNATIRLSELLNSQAKPLFKTFERIREYSANVDIPRHPVGVRLHELEMDALIHQCKYDMNVIKQIIRNTNTATSNLKVRQYQARVEELKRQQSGVDGNEYKSLLDEISDRLNGV
jgi:hypothetical protein